MLSHPQQTRTISGKEWRDYCKKHDTLIFLSGYGYRLRVRSIGGGVYELYCKSV